MDQFGRKLKLVMAVSADGFVAKGPRDDMRWTGHLDKQLFKLLTVSHPVLLVGRKTFEVMPKLPWRRVVPLSRDPTLGVTLEQAVSLYPGAWLGGGAEVAETALRAGLVETTYLCRVGARLGGGLPLAPIRALLSEHPRHVSVLDLGCSVEVFQDGP